MGDGNASNAVSSSGPLRSNRASIAGSLRVTTVSRVPERRSYQIMGGRWRTDITREVRPLPSVVCTA
jgi:hypothetical protein